MSADKAKGDNYAWSIGAAFPDLVGAAISVFSLERAKSIGHGYNSKMRLRELQTRCLKARAILFSSVADCSNVPGGQKGIFYDFRQSFRYLATAILSSEGTAAPFTLKCNFC